MKKSLARKQRMVRARDVQHSQALAEAVHARDETRSLEGNAERLRLVREELYNTHSMTTGQSLAAHRELAMRLEQAGRQLAGAIYDARLRQTKKEELRVVANREREIAERLKNRAAAALEAYREARLQALPRRNRKSIKTEVSA